MDIYFLIEVVVKVRVLRILFVKRIKKFQTDGWLQVEGQLSAYGTRAFRGRALHGGLSKECQPIFTRVLETTAENSERLGRQTRLGIEPGISCQPVFSEESFGHWWGHTYWKNISLIVLHWFCGQRCHFANTSEKFKWHDIQKCNLSWRREEQFFSFNRRKRLSTMNGAAIQLFDNT